MCAFAGHKEPDGLFQLTSDMLVIDAVFQLLIAELPSFNVAVEYGLNPIDHVVKLFVPLNRL